ncbi:FUSC family protein [Ameyamaea chiangmaiensis]|nr:FUSC family protein [Ameyamaea chiangmaiensis]
MAAGCTATVLVGEIWQVPDLAVPALVTMALWQKDRVTNALAGVGVNILIAVLLTLMYGLIALTLDHPLGLVVAAALLSFGFFFLGSASKLRPVAYMLGLIIVYALVTIDRVPVGEVITRALLYADLFLAVPGAVMLVLGLLICPSPRTVAMHGIAARLYMAARLLRGADPVERERATDLLRQGAADMLKALGMARFEFLWPKPELDALRQAAFSSVAVLALALERHEASPGLIARIDARADAFAHGDCPADETAPGHTPIDRLLGGFSTPRPDTQAPNAEAPSGFFVPDAFTNPDHVRFAVKGTAAVMTSYLLFKALDWDGIHTCIITCFIVALPTMGEMIAKLSLRIAGALAGGALGIVAIIAVIPHLDGITGFLMLVFAVSLLGAWVKAGDERIAYGGFQIGLAFYLTVLKGYGPTTDMATARDRIVGIMIGNAITYAMFTSVWPTSARGRARHALRAVARALRQQNDAPPALQPRRATEVQAALSEGERAVEFAAAEPVHLRAEHEALRDSRAALTDAAQFSAQRLAGPVAHARSHIDRLEDIAL